MQMHELEAYLGNFANDITDEQKAALLCVADEIDGVYASDGLTFDEYAARREAAYSAAVQYVMGDLGAAELRATQRVAADALLSAQMIGPDASFDRVWRR